MKKIYKGFISYKEFHVELQLLIREEWELTAWVTEICGLLCYQMQQSVLIQCFPNRLFDRNSQQLAGPVSFAVLLSEQRLSCPNWCLEGAHGTLSATTVWGKQGFTWCGYSSRWISISLLRESVYLRVCTSFSYNTSVRDGPGPHPCHEFMQFLALIWERRLDKFMFL